MLLACVAAARLLQNFVLKRGINERDRALPVLREEEMVVLREEEMVVGHVL